MPESLAGPAWVPLPENPLRSILTPAELKSKLFLPDPEGLRSGTALEDWLGDQIGEPPGHIEALNIRSLSTDGRSTGDDLAASWFIYMSTKVLRLLRIYC